MFSVLFFNKLKIRGTARSTSLLLVKVRKVSMKCIKFLSLSLSLSLAHSHTGPLSKTLTDHWRMIWQEQVHTIVMVTNVKEDKKIKCQQYWPEDDFRDFGPFRVTLTDQQTFTNFAIRLLQVEVSGTSVCIAPIAVKCQYALLLY